MAQNLPCDIRFIPKHATGRGGTVDQWMLGAEDYADVEEYGVDKPSIQCVKALVNLVPSSRVRLTANAVTDHYEGELHWQGFTITKKSLLEDLDDLQRGVDNGTWEDDTEALSLGVATWMVRQCYDVIGFVAAEARS